MSEKPYLDLIDSYQEKMIEDLQGLVRIKSVQASAEEEMPFGEGVQRAFEYMLELGKREGFTVRNVDNYGGHLDFGGTLYNEEGKAVGVAEETMAILGHLDVVPEGSDWELEPYSAEIRDGRMYGRGTSDDKGPMIAAFYGMKAIKDAGYEPQKKVRMILGLDEETGWIGMKKYFEKVEKPDFGFTPDGDFPAIHGEKGLLIFEIAGKFAKTPGNAKGIQFRKADGGNAPNMVADHAKVLIRNEGYEEIKEKLRAFQKEKGYKIAYKGRGKSLEIFAEGISAHGAMPQNGLNAISILMEFLGELNFTNESVMDFFDFYNRYIGFSLDGSKIGCDFHDEASGDLIWNVGQIEMDEESVRLTVNIRYPISKTDEEVFGAMMPLLHKHNLGIVKLEHKAPIYLEKDHPVIRTLMDCYQEFTGDYETESFVIGGGSYARAIPNAVAFGMLFPGEEDSMHQKNESISIESLMKATKIYAEAIFRLSEAKKIPIPEEKMEK